MDEWQPGFLQSSPLFEPLRGVGEPIEKLDRWPTLAELNALLSPSILTTSGKCIRFVPQGPKPARVEDKYEARIYLTGEVQTRTENWHDLFNALVWLAFPQTKAAINARHFAALSHGSEGNRGNVQDAMTLFDESGVIVSCADHELAGLLRDFQWHQLFWMQRRAVTERMKFVIFGHSLYEKALQPYIGFTGKGLMMGEAVGEGELDARLAERLAHGEPVTSRSLTPVPLLGVPGWWAENDSPEFYANTAYFRPPKK